MFVTARALIASRHRAFTLIELLVVISIIAILAAMLLPAVKLVRDAANNSKCGSNQRNIAVAIQAYATDNDGSLPYRDVSSEWPNQAINYLESQYQVAPQKNRKDVFHCPFAVREIASPWLFSYRFSSHYGMNDHIRVCWTGSDWKGVWRNPGPVFIPQPPIPIASLPPNLVLLTENKAWGPITQVYFEDAVNEAVNGPWPVGLMGPSSGTSAPIIWHAKTVNFVCVDGHIERVTGQWDASAMQPRFKAGASVL